jgi:serine/threonine protein kinase
MSQEDPMGMTLPRTFGPYVLLHRLASGGMAEVYVAKAKGLGGFEKLIAIKVIHPRYFEDDNFVRLLVEEAKITVLLNHTNIGQIFDLGCVDETYYIAMEYIDGVDGYRILRRSAEKQVKLGEDVCAFIAAEMCAGLHYAHQQRQADGTTLGIVHRDVSPQNILVTRSGEVKVVDFGIAKSSMRARQTDAGIIKGKYYYMSPEQAWAEPIDSRTDIYSTGVVLYELLTGAMLYKEEPVLTLLDKVRKAEIPPPTSRRPELSPELVRIIMRAVAKKPEDRFNSAREMGEALTRFLHTHSPTFTRAKIADVLASLCPEAKALHGELMELSHTHSVQEAMAAELEAELVPMKKDEFVFEESTSIILDRSAYQKKADLPATRADDQLEVAEPKIASVNRFDPTAPQRPSRRPPPPGPEAPFVPPAPPGAWDLVSNPDAPPSHDPDKRWDDDGTVKDDSPPEMAELANTKVASVRPGLATTDAGTRTHTRGNALPWILVGVLLVALVILYTLKS